MPVVVLSMTVTTADNETLSRPHMSTSMLFQPIRIAKGARKQRCVSKRKHDMPYVDITLQSL